MPLFGHTRDIDLFRTVNRELFHSIVETYIDIFTITVDTTHNIYGEGENKRYNDSVRLACKIIPDPIETEQNNKGIDKAQTIFFGFLRDDLVDCDILVNEGDIINWDNRYWEIDSNESYKYFITKNPQTNKSIHDGYGWRIDLICKAHITDENKTGLITNRSGFDKSNY